MTSQLERRYSYSEPPQRVQEVLTDPEYLRDKLRTVGGPRAELVSREEDQHGITIVAHQGVPDGALPSFLRSTLPDGLTVRRTETWTSSGASMHADVDGVPGTITGTMSLQPDPGGSVLSMHLEARVPLPLVGGKVEKAITDGVGRLMDTEYQFTLQWLRDSAAT
ncbi:MAG TPA: DUF2505 domain-containing protein [Pseudonocardiaceae bacterium]